MIPSRQGLKILHLDDSLADAEFVERELQSAGLPFTLQRTSSRDGFMQALEEFLPDVVLAGYPLPDFDGLAAVRLVREKDADLPVILVSGVLGDEAAVSAIKAGAHDCVLKSGLARLVPAIEKAVAEAEHLRFCRRTEEALRLSEERYRSLIMAIAKTVWTTDAGGQVIEDQPGWRDYTGQTGEEIRGAGWLTAVHPDSREQAASAWMHAVAQIRLGKPNGACAGVTGNTGVFRSAPLRCGPRPAASADGSGAISISRIASSAMKN